LCAPRGLQARVAFLQGSERSPVPRVGSSPTDLHHSRDGDPGGAWTQRAPTHVPGSGGRSARVLQGKCAEPLRPSSSFLSEDIRAYPSQGTSENTEQGDTLRVTLQVPKSLRRLTAKLTGAVRSPVQRMLGALCLRSERPTPADPAKIVHGTNGRDTP